MFHAAKSSKQRIFFKYFRQISNIESRTRMEIADRLLRLSKPKLSPVQVSKLTNLPEDTVKQMTDWIGRKIVVSFRDETLTRLELLNYFRSFGAVENLSFRSNKAFVTFKYLDNATECAKKKVHRINKKRIQCNILDPGNSEHFAKLNLLEVCPKCQSEFKPPKPERNEFGTIIVEVQEERLQEALREKVDVEANFNLVQANSGSFVILDFRDKVPSHFTDFLDAENFSWFHFSPETNFKKPTADDPFVDNTIVQPKDGENLRFFERLSMFLDAHPEGIPEREFETKFYEMFPNSQKEYAASGLRYFVLSNFYPIVKVISTPSGTRLWVSRIRPPKSPPDLVAKFRNPSVLMRKTEERFEQDVRAMADFEQGGFYLSQFPDLFLKHFAYLPQRTSRSLKLILQDAGCTYKALEASENFDLFFQKHVPYRWNSQTKSQIQQIVAEHGIIPESRFQPLWEKQFGDTFCTESPEKMRTLLQERVREINYDIVHGERVYKFKGEFKDLAIAVHVQVQNKDHGWISCEDVVQTFLDGGRVDKTRIEWTPMHTNIQVMYFKSNPDALRRIQAIPDLTLNSIPIFPKSTTFGAAQNDFKGPCIHVSTVGLYKHGGNAKRTQITPNDLRYLFSPFGDIQKILLNLKHYPQTWWCLISFSNYQAVEDALSQSEFHIKDMILHCRRISPTGANDGWGLHKVLLKNLASHIRTKDLAQFFSSRGHVFDNVKVFLDDDGNSAGEGVIQFRDRSVMDEVLNMESWEINGSHFICEPKIVQNETAMYK